MAVQQSKIMQQKKRARLQHNNNTRAQINAALARGGASRTAKGGGPVQSKTKAVAKSGTKAAGKRSQPEPTENVVSGHQSLDRGPGKRQVKPSVKLSGPQED